MKRIKPNSAVLEKHTDGGTDSPYSWTHTGGALDGQAVEWIDVATGTKTTSETERFGMALTVMATLN